jgi:hypothetical protein
MTTSRSGRTARSLCWFRGRRRREPGGGGGLGDLGGTEELFDQEPIDPRPPIPDAPAFTIDDLIDFHFRLVDEGYIQAFLAKQ